MAHAEHAQHRGDWTRRSLCAAVLVSYTYAVERLITPHERRSGGNPHAAAIRRRLCPRVLIVHRCVCLLFANIAFFLAHFFFCHHEHLQLPTGEDLELLNVPSWMDLCCKVCPSNPYLAVVCVRFFQHSMYVIVKTRWSWRRRGCHTYVGK